jgi:hypothetical protein
MKRSVIIGAVLLVIGIVIGWLCRQSCIRPQTIIQRDTLVRVDTVSYSRLELEANRIRLEIPDIRMRRYVFIETERLDTVYRDNIQYVKMPREYYYTRVKDAEVWHSGIDSTIDSLNVVVKTAEITKNTISAQPKNSIGIGIEPSYMNTLSIPIYLEYGRMLHKNIEIYGQIAYDLPSKTFGAGIGIKAGIQW